MTNAELITKIRAEIERLYDGEAPAHDQQCDFDDGYFTGIGAISKFLDTLEEPVKGLDVTDFCKPIDPGIAQCIADHSWEMLGEDEKPATADLEEAAREYTQKMLESWRFDSTGCRPPRESFIAGAKWQAEQFEKNRLAACDKMTEEEYDRESAFALEIIDKEHRMPTFIDAINYGMELQKEQDTRDMYMSDNRHFQKVYELGKKDMKEQMMKEAVEGEVCGRVYDHINVRFADGVCKYLEPKNISHIPADVSKYKVGDKVRIIIVKED